MRQVLQARLACIYLLHLATLQWLRGFGPRYPTYFGADSVVLNLLLLARQALRPASQRRDYGGMSAGMVRVFFGFVPAFLDQRYWFVFVPAVALPIAARARGQGATGRAADRNA